VIILFEGWDAAGKGTTIHSLTDPIDPRGYKIYPIRASRTYEKKRPWLWRFWLKIPARGEWAIFDRSWYGRVLVERMLKLVPKAEWKRAYRDIVDFERTLTDDGTLIIKFFLHISKKEQEKRFKKLEDDRLNAWRVTEEDWRNHDRYNKWLLVYEEMLERTDSEWGPWTIVEATDKYWTRVKVYETIINALEEHLGITPEKEAGEEAAENETQPPSSASVEQTASEMTPEPAPEPPKQSPETSMAEAGLAEESNDQVKKGRAAPDKGSEEDSQESPSSSEEVGHAR
jgi:polyphosphate kinase 2 (PPK2 family)